MQDQAENPGINPDSPPGTSSKKPFDELLSLQACVLNAPVSIYRIDESGVILDVNRQACTNLGYTRDELLRLSIFDIAPTVDQAGWAVHIKNLKSEGSRKVEGLHRRKDGSLFPVEVVVNGYEVEGVWYSYSFAQDISERKRHIETLKTSERRFRILSEASFEGVILSSQGIFIDLNDQMAQMLGYTRDELIGTPILACVAAQDQPRVENFIRNGSVEPYELTAVRKNGTPFPIRVQTKALHNEGKDVRVSAIRDISDQKQAEENHKRLLYLESEAMQVAGLGFWEYDIAGETFTFNDQYFVLHGTDVKRAGGYQIPARDFINKFIPPNDSLLLERAFRLALQTSDPNFHHQFEGRILKESGELVDVIVWFRIEKDAAGQTSHLYGVTQNNSERKQAERALRESEFFLRKSQDVGNLGSYYFDVLTGNWTSSNKLDQVFGIDKAFPRNVEGWISLIHPEDQVEMLHHLRDVVIAQHNRFDKEYRIIRHNDHALRWVHGQGELEFDEQGNTRHMLGTIQDITRRKKDEEALQASEERLRLALEGNSDAIWDWDLPNDVVYFSPRYYTMLGYEPGEFPASFEQWQRLVHPDHLSGALQVVHQAIEAGGSYAAEFRMRKKDGSWVWVLTRGKVVQTDANGKAIRLSGSHTDITARKQAEIALQQNEAQLRLLTDNMEDVITQIDTEGTIRYMSSSGERAFGTPVSEFMGQPLSRWIHPEDQPHISRTVIDASQAGITATLLEYRMRHASGHYLWREATIRVLYNAEGKPEGAVVCSRDISERKQAEARVRELNEALEERILVRTAQLQNANKELEAFAYSVSHDLRAPLRAINGYTAILMEEYLPLLGEEGKRVCEVVSDEANRMGQLIDDLLEFSRLGRTEMQRGPVDMNALVNSVFHHLSISGDTSRVKLQKSRLIDTEADPNLLRQVWTNLLSNAIKFSSHCPFADIEVGSREEGNMICYWVRDQGAGFDMRYQDKLFGVFQRLHSSNEFEGTGVGLAIVRRIIERHGGKVSAVGEVGKGATFSFTLPRKGKSA